MRANYVGNTALQERLHRPDPEVRAIVEAVVVSQSDTKETQGDWAGSGSGLTRPQIGGARLIRDTDATHAQHDTASADQENVTTDLDNTSPWLMLELEWTETDAPDFEIHQFTATLDPDVGDTGRDVSEFRAQLYRVATESENEYQLQQISAQAVAEVTGNAQDDFSFDFSGSEVGEPPEPGDSPTGEDEFEASSNPITIVKVWAVDSDGAAAGNCAWVGDNDDSASGTLITDGATNVATARFRDLRSVDDAQRVNTGGRFEKFGNGDGIPDFSLTGKTYTEATATFTGIDLGSSPESDTDIVVVAQGEEPGDSSLTWEISDDSGSSWTEVVDGDVVGENNTPDGSDLSSVSRQQTYDMRVTLSPSTDGHTSPFARRIGVEEMTATDLDGVASVEDAGNWSFDPVTLVGEIPEATISLLKDGVRDYRSEGERLFADHHIGDMTFRVWIGHPDLPRKNWLLVDAFEVDDTKTGGASIDAICLSPLRRLKVPIPPYDTGANERTPVEYTNQTLKAAWDDLLDSQVALPGRFRGPGVEDTTSQSVSKTLRDSDGKTELDAIAHLAGGTVVTSQGKVKYQDAFLEDKGGIKATFAREEIQVKAIEPGFRNRVEEYFAPYAYDDDRDEFDGEVRSFYEDAIAKLGGKGLDAPDELDEAAARWLPTPNDKDSHDPAQNLASHVASRTTSPNGLGPGLKQVRFTSTIPHPELEPGDAVVVETDQLVIKDPATDTAFRGLLWLTGVVQTQHDVWGRELTVWVQQIEDATPSEEDTTRTSFADPRVTSAQTTVQDDGSLDVDINTREAGAVKVAADSSAFPSKSTVQGQGLNTTDSDGLAEINDLATDIPIGFHYISILAYENADGSGAESEERFKTKAVRTGDDDNLATTVEVDDGNVNWDQGAWTAGDIEVEDGAVYSVNANTTGSVGDDDFRTIYLDPAVSTTELQVTKTADYSPSKGKYRLGLFKRASASDENPLVTVGSDLRINVDHLSVNSLEAIAATVGTLDIVDDLYLGTANDIRWGSSASPATITKTRRIAQASFMAESDSTSYGRGSGYLTPGGGSTTSEFFYSLVLPEGVVITEIVLRAYRETTSNEVRLLLYEGESTDMFGTLITTLTHDTTGYQSKSSGSLSETVGTNPYMLMLDMTADVQGIDARFVRADVTYDTSNLRQSL